MATKDRGVAPDYLNRAFRSYETRTVNKMSDQVMADARGKAREEAKEKRRKDLEALEAMQAKRALKPPGRR